MKRYLTIFALLCTISTAHGARFIYSGGGLRAFCKVEAKDGSYSWGPFSQTMNHPTSASVDRYAGPPPLFTPPYSRAYNYILSKTGNNSIFIKSYSIADGAADYSWCETKGEGFGGTQYFENLGIFYKIIPDANEQDGDDVMVYYNDTKSIVTDNGTTNVCIGGPGTMSDMVITRGLEPPVTTEPGMEYEVLRLPKFEVSNSSSAELFSGVHAFPAQIGDVIGIFAENKTKVEGSGPLAGYIYSTFTMILTVRPVLLGDSDYDGDVDFFDLAILANNWLEGVGGTEPPPDTTPPHPDPVLWAVKPYEIGDPPFNVSATMTAATATDPSVPVQYYFWCTNTSGLSSDWQSDPKYTVLIGPSGTGRKFRVKARDSLGNESVHWSTEETAN